MIFNSFQDDFFEIIIDNYDIFFISKREDVFTGEFIADDDEKRVMVDLSNKIIDKIWIVLNNLAVENADGVILRDDT